MRSLVLIVSFFFFAAVICFGQSNKYSIYVGKVTGVTKQDFISAYTKYDYERDSVFEIQPITESVYPIEIRLYEEPSATGVTGYTMLYFDSSFHIKRTVKVYPDWKDYKAKELYPINEKNADSVFAKLMVNGIFDLQEYTENLEGKFLTENGFIERTKLCGGLDGVHYLVKTKVGNVFHQFHCDYWGLKCFPDNHELRRKSEIVKQLEANLRLVKK